MPFQSESQRKFMWSQHPDIAQRWSNEGKGFVQKDPKQEAIKRRMKNGNKHS